MRLLTPIACAAALACSLPAAHSQTVSTPATPDSSTAAAALSTLPSVTVRASADASAQGLSPAFAGGQVAKGGRAGVLGTRAQLETPISLTSYTNELIQDRQARSVGDVLQNDPGVRVARGFGNFQESYFIRGFILNSDDVAYNGLYGLLPRQYIATELFERVEVLRGASAFLNGANPGGGGIGGAVNLLPKRAPNESLTRATLSLDGGGQTTVSTDIARRFGPDRATGMRVNAAYRNGESSVDREQAQLGLLSIGLDWRSRDVRLSGDVGYQNNRLKEPRPNVSLLGTGVPAAPDASSNFAQPWSYSNESDVFATLRGEYDVNPDVTAWAAYGLRRSDEGNSLANLDVTSSSTGAATTYRFDNSRKDQVDTGELGLRGKLHLGSVGHEWVASISAFRLDKKTAYVFDAASALPTNLYAPTLSPQPAFGPGAFGGNDLGSPALTSRTKLISYAIGDTMSMVGDQLLVTLGLRHQKLDITDYAYGTGTAGTPYDRSRTSPMAGVVFKLNNSWSIYGNYVEGLTQGETAPGFLTPPPANAGQSLPPYVSKQKEIGLKYETARLGGGLALFSTEKPRSTINAANVFTADGRDRHTGVELTAYGKASQNLKVLGGAVFLNAKQTRTGVVDTEGKRVIGVPRAQANVGAEWAVPAVSGLALDARVVYTGASQANAENTLRVPGWTRLDAGMRYLFDVGGRPVTLRGRVDNLTDRNHWASVGGYAGSGYLTVGKPRTFVLSASVDY